MWFKVLDWGQQADRLAGPSMSPMSSLSGASARRAARVLHANG
ncbi:hypothetical protein [Nonomuraea sp. 10N515B]